MRRALLLLLAALASAAAAAGPVRADGKRSQPGEQLEKAITEASSRYDRGEIKAGSPFTVRLADGRTVSFSAERFDADLDAAFALLEALLRQQRAGTATAAVTAPGVAATRPAPGRADESAQGGSRLDSLMQAERSSSAAAPAPRAAPPADFSVYGNYRGSRDERIEAEDRAAEADMQQVIVERQAATAARARKLERDQALQQQAMRWQDELDRQATASAKAAAQWEAEHSPAAYAKSFLGTVIQTTVGAFTGGFLGVVSTNLANKAVRSLFREKDGGDGKDGGPPHRGPEGAPAAATGSAGTDAPPAGSSSVLQQLTGKPKQQTAGEPSNRADTTRFELRY